MSYATKIAREAARDLNLSDRAAHELDQFAERVEKLPDDEARALAHRFADASVDRSLGGAAILVALAIKEDRFLSSLADDAARDDYVRRNLHEVVSVGRGFDPEPEAEED
ncbi:MAG: hypothetical protein QM704_14855 [Anaeromyxobacteraceae bacterium]